MLLSDTFYHIYNHANGNENLFRNDENYYYFLQKFAHYINPIADTYAYCLMPNHIHFLIKIKSDIDLETTLREKKPILTGFANLSGQIPQQFSNLFNSYSKAYNEMYDRKGSLFMRLFKRKPVESDLYFTTVVHYIHANPVHHGFCTDIYDWKHSSIHSHLSNRNSHLKRNEVLDWFGGKDNFIKFHQQDIDPKMNLYKEFKIFFSVSFDFNT